MRRSLAVEFPDRGGRLSPCRRGTPGPDGKEKIWRRHWQPVLHLVIAFERAADRFWPHAAQC